MTQTTLSQIHQTIKAKNQIVILPHKKPDGDTLGSSIALCRYLSYLGKTAAIFLTEPIPENLSFLDKSCFTDQPPAGVDLVISIDSSDPDRHQGRLELFNAPIINIDHHQTNTFFGDYNYVLPTSSTGEIIYQILKAWDAPFDEATRDALYAAIATDTNRFYYRSTTAATLRAVADLIDQGLEPIKLNTLIYGQVPLAKKQLQAYALSNAVLRSEGRFIMAEVSKEVQVQFGTNDTDDIVENLRDIAGVEVAMLSYQYGETWQLSLRSKEKVNVGAIAQSFGGGGHFGAAGIAIHSDYLTVLQAVIDRIEAELA